MSDKNNEKSNKPKNPHLFCLITGKSRPTTWAYLKNKAERLGTDAETLVNNYVSREAITQLLDGKTVEQIRAAVKDAPKDEISNDRLAALIRMNSKAKKAAEKFKPAAATTETPSETPAETPSEPVAAEPTETKPKKGKKGKKGKTDAPVDMPTETPVEAVVEHNAGTPAEVPAEAPAGE